MKKSRREFLKLAGGCALGVGTVSALDLVGPCPAGAEEYAHPEDALTATHWGMVIDTAAFHGPEDFEPLIEACHSIHNVPKIEGPKEVKWIWTDHFHAVFAEPVKHLPEEVEHREFLLLCNHCEQPSCVRVCPTKATFKRESDGIVLMDMHRCIGCRFCMAACPYGSRSFNFYNPRPRLQYEENTDYPTRMRGVVEKCNFCAERLAVGLMPACVEASEGKILFGDLDDPDSEVRHALNERFAIRRKPSLGTEPSVYYII